MLHQVNKLQFEATCATEAQAFELRHNFSLARQDEIAAIIDKVCSQYVGEDEWIQIDRIEVELEHFSLHAFENIFTSLLQEKLEKAISKKISAIPAAKRIASKQTTYLEILFYFLQTGTLPWWVEEAISMDTIFIEVAQKRKEALSRFLQQHKMNSLIWKRIGMQFNDKVQEQIFSFFPELVLAKEKIGQWIALMAAEKINKGFEAILSNDTKKKRDEFILFHAPQFFIAAEQNNTAPQLIEDFAKEFKSILYEDIPVSAIIDKIIAHEKAETKFSADELNKTVGAKEQLLETNDLTEITIAEKFTVHTAGTVLLAPYFKQLFIQLNLLQQDEWTNAETHYKAIHLIRYMATGQLMCAEHELVMEKLLCGMGITAPIPREVTLTDEEKNEAMELLKAVIRHWSKLKNTSVDGLRETFLKRKGILTKKDNGWLLQVEKKTADVLLESIPWGYSTLAFSWNNYIIFTEW
jgi:hypothetical protein